MKRSREFVARRVGAFAVALLVLIPLFFSGHLHGSRAPVDSSECAVCLATSHSPGTQVTLVPLLAPLTESIAVVVSVVAAPSHAHLPQRTGRAPPPSAVTIPA